MKIRGFVGALCIVIGAAPAFAAETVTYTYDAKGRLVTVSHAGTQNAGQVTVYQYDTADNRTNVTVTGASH